MASEQSEQKSRLWVYIFWLGVLGSLTLVFNDFIFKKNNPNHQLATSSQSGETVVLKRNFAGHYVAPGTINGHPVTFLLDTGATSVSVPARVANDIGLKEGHRIRVSTANGVVDVFSTQLETVQLGGITVSKVQASINPHMTDEMVLLGMSFMKHLDMQQRGNTLTLSLP